LLRSFERPIPKSPAHFKGDGKAANLAFVSAHKGEPLADKETTMLVFTEKDHSKDKRPDIKASFGSYGSALIIRS
jgi:hypothetical protein